MQFHVLGSILMALLGLVIFGFLSYVYWQNIQSIKSYQKYFLLILRTLTLILILFLILDPWFQWSKKIDIQENLSVYLDSSMSMKSQLEFDNIEISDLKSQIDNWSEKNNVNSEWYLFGEEIRAASIRGMGIFSDSLTNFTHLPDHMLINNSQQFILISDGQSNMGMEIKHLQFNKEIKIHIIGVGSDSLVDDLWIDNINAPTQVFIEDSVLIKITMGYELNADVNVDIYFDGNGEVNNSMSIKIPSGKGFIDIEKSIMATQIIDLKYVKIHADIEESNLENNIELIKIEVNRQKKGILLVSSGLSPNTHLIKNLLTKLPQHELTHIYRKNKLEWNVEIIQILKNSSIELIIFDDFPGSSKDISIYQNIINNSLWESYPKIYIEGPKSNASTAETLSKKLNTSIRIIDNISDHKIVFFNDVSIFKRVDITSIPPSKKQMNWESDVDNVIYGFDDESSSIVKNNNFYGFFIQDAQELILSESRNHKSVLKDIFSDILLHAFTGDENLLKVISDKHKYMANSPILFNIEKSPILGFGLVELKVINQINEPIKEIIIDANENHSNTQFFTQPGDYMAIASMETKGGVKVKSTPYNFRIMEKLLEEDNLFENKKELERLAWKNGGTYADPSHLEAILKTLNSRPKSQLKEYKFSALSTQRYWWILIIILSIEWFLRKREGLL